MKPRYVCIHGHFYQPPRENPWLDAVQVEPSAAPYHDWNARITDECYAQNARSRVLDEQGLVKRIVNNYSSMSFNFGPTLLSWLEAEAPRVYAAILEADRDSQRRFGHGSAMAQSYNHSILPLCNERDRRSQVKWGKADFEARFGRAPDGMWLPETAVDIASLEALAAEGIAFTVLEPRQALRMRKLGSKDWVELEHGIDPSRAYRCNLPSGRSIALFFYDGPVSRAVAFERLLTRGEGFAERLLGLFHEPRDWAEIVHIATDGETYGHHHRFGDMGLAYALHTIELSKRADLINYATYLAKHPPDHEVEIRENTAWSCAHGIERWRSDCGCSSGGSPGWNQAWRTPLRESLDWLRDTLAPLYEQHAAPLLADPWAARDDYIRVILDRSAASRTRFIETHRKADLDGESTTKVLELCEMQRNAMLMYTSCGWFFDDLAGIESVQVLRYAARAIELAERISGQKLEAQFVQRLAAARSNTNGDGSRIWERFVRPARIEVPDIAAHFVARALFVRDAADQGAIYGHELEPTIEHSLESGDARLIIGRIKATEISTRRSWELAGAVLHFGDHRIVGGVRSFEGFGTHEMRVRELADAFATTPVEEMHGLIEGYFPGSMFTLKSLFVDEQRYILEQIVSRIARQAAEEQRTVYDRSRGLLRYLAEQGNVIPTVLQRTAIESLNAALKHAFESEVPDVRRVGRIVEDARHLRIALEDPEIARVASQTVARLVRRLEQRPFDVALLGGLARLTALALDLGLRVDAWEAQNVFYQMTLDVWPKWRERAASGEPEAVVWREAFLALGRALRVRVD